MIPSVLSYQIRKGIEDFLKTTFPVSTPFFHGIIDRLLEKDGELFRGPYISVKLPFRTGILEPDFFKSIPLGFAPYLHQVNAFKRIGGDTPPINYSRYRNRFREDRMFHVSYFGLLLAA